jgi:hypothetical protein
MSVNNLRTNYIFIDFENVQPSLTELPSEYPMKIVIFVGAKQNKIPIDIVMAMQRMGSNAEYIVINESGKNALDFHITFYLGNIAANNPDAFFHIISKDSGFDILLKHLKERQIQVNRYTDIAEIPLLRQLKCKSLSEEQLIEMIIGYLRRRGNAKPRKLETLFNFINSHCGRSLEKKKIEELIQVLIQKQLIRL